MVDCDVMPRNIGIQNQVGAKITLALFEELYPVPTCAIDFLKLGFLTNPDSVFPEDDIHENKLVK